MNAIKSKLLLTLAKNKKKDQGFTLIELLVVIIIIGILSAIALPNLLSQTSKARQSEAKSNIGALIRGQQAYRLEEATFATDLDALDVSVEGQFYTYSADTNNDATSGIVTADDTTQYEGDLKSYQGGGFQPAGEDFFSGVCEDSTASKASVTASISTNGSTEATCSAGNLVS